MADRRYCRHIAFVCTGILCGITLAVNIGASKKTSSSLVDAKSQDCENVSKLVTPTEGEQRGRAHYIGGIATDAKGYVYVTEGALATVAKLDPSGKIIARFGRSPKGIGRYDKIGGIAVGADGNIYVMYNLWQSKIAKLNSQGEQVAEWSLCVSGDDADTYPTSIALDKEDHVYVSSGPTEVVQKYDTSGKLLAKWGSRTGKEQWMPGPLVVDSKGNVYVHDVYNACIRKYTPSGESAGIILSPKKSGLNFPGGLAIDANDNLYVSDLQFIRRFDCNGKPLGKWDAGKEAFLATLLAVSRSGDVYVCEGVYNVIHFSSSGKVMGRWTNLDE
ncbi:MAG: hypothetical protein ABFD54_12315 [Armatimonadota bacterium]|nr:hypothetical protein [bacterium]